MRALEELDEIMAESKALEKRLAKFGLTLEVKKPKAARKARKPRAAKTEAPAKKAGKKKTSKKKSEADLL